ncbi:MAG: exosortase-dependent surface protein XDP2 [Mastigocoleus sp.]
MKLKNLLTSTALIFAGTFTVSNSAQAASFITNVDQDTDSKADVLLQSVTQNGQTITDFSYVNRVDIQRNSPRDGGSNSGAASTDRGENASEPELTNEDPIASEIAAYLGNNNLNNIIDTEDSGYFTLDLFFDSEISKDSTGLDSLFVWERGMNSDLQVQAIDSEGNLLGKSLKLEKNKNQTKTSFKIDTTEASNQKVGSWGVSFADLGLGEEVNSFSGIQVVAEKEFKGPDFKVIARKGATVPEPATILGLSAIAGLGFLGRRKSKAVSNLQDA